MSRSEATDFHNAEESLPQSSVSSLVSFLQADEYVPDSRLPSLTLDEYDDLDRAAAAEFAEAAFATPLQDSDAQFRTPLNEELVFEDHERRQFAVFSPFSSGYAMPETPGSPSSAYYMRHDAGLSTAESEDGISDYENGRAERKRLLPPLPDPPSVHPPVPPLPGDFASPRDSSALNYDFMVPIESYNDNADIMLGNPQPQLSLSGSEGHVDPVRAVNDLTRSQLRRTKDAILYTAPLSGMPPVPYIPISKEYSEFADEGRDPWGRQPASMCVSVFLLVIGLCFPPLWLLVAVGHLDAMCGFISSSMKLIALTLSTLTMIAAIALVVVFGILRT